MTYLIMKNVFFHSEEEVPPTSLCIFSTHPQIGLKRFFSGVSPMRSTLATETGANNPGLRLVKYNENGQVFFNI